MIKYILTVLISSLIIAPGYTQKRIIVSQDGKGNYRTIQEAINAVPDRNMNRTEIFVKKGSYKERVIVSKSKINITLIGEDAKETIITWDDYAAKKDSSGKDLGTFRTATFYIYGTGFSAKNITFENSSGPVGQALSIFVAADKVAFFNCRFLGCQDTIYTNGNGSRQYYSECYIEGTTDFIFGAATALFDQCDINCKKGGQYLTAASTLDTTKYGYVFLKCNIGGNAPENTFALGRPWRPNAKVVFLYCYLSNVIKNTGWNNWGKPDNEKTAYYAEFKNTGPGYKPAERYAWSHQLTEEEAKIYTPALILANWKPEKP